MSAPLLSVVLPIYNEALILDGTVARLLPFLAGLTPDFELICVDDGSTDRSREILESAAHDDARIRVEVSPRNRGKGAAVRRGMLAAAGDRVVFMDADLSTQLEELPALLEALDSGYPVVIGNRRAPGSHLARRQPLLRETLGKGFTILSRLLLAPGIHDFTCGFKGFSRKAAQEIFRRSTQDGWTFDVELVVIAQELNFKLAQVPVTWRHEDNTKVRLASAIFASLRELTVIRWKRFRGEYR